MQQLHTLFSFSHKTNVWRSNGTLFTLSPMRSSLCDFANAKLTSNRSTRYNANRKVYLKKQTHTHTHHATDNAMQTVGKKCNRFSLFSICSTRNTRLISIFVHVVSCLAAATAAAVVVVVVAAVVLVAWNAICGRKSCENFMFFFAIVASSFWSTIRGLYHWIKINSCWWEWCVWSRQN